MSKPYHVFISYATEDEQFASELANGLKWYGLSVWFAPIALKIGSRLLDSINAGLIASEYGLLLLSPTYISKKWTSYELDVLHRQHIEENKRLLPIWHGVGKTQLDNWNPGLSGIIALRSTDGASAISKKIADLVYQGCPVVGVNPSYEDPQWRFLQGRGELYANHSDGSAFNLFEAALFPDNHFPIYVHERPHSRKDILLAVAKAVFYGSYEKLSLSDEKREQMKALCKDFGFDLDQPNFDPAIYG
ncbi:toll/interleukin-1 receptor domain-containing protein [Roseateles sp. 22389]|uniref:toll/interleukin-1 receptor domain-containing protein n=1 Tax=Roseateles sp. 22389 TaxID=3453916 RepID=UPI003F85D296